MSKLMHQLATLEGKKPFQTYTIHHGIERITVLVPLAEAKKFETRFSELADKKKLAVIALVEQLGGRVKP